MTRRREGDPVVPRDLEQVVLSRGPMVLAELVREVGGVGRAAEIGGTSIPTVTRWLETAPGSVFGSPRDHKTWRSIWPGYPSPFPGLDRIVEEIIGPEQSFVGMMVERYGWARAWEHITASKGFGTDLLDFDEAEIAEVCTVIGVPRTTQQRWWYRLKYPSQWRVLDRLSVEHGAHNWIDAVLAIRPTPIRRIPSGALACLIGC